MSNTKRKMMQNTKQYKRTLIGVLMAGMLYITGGVLFTQEVSGSSSVSEGLQRGIEEVLAEHKADMNATEVMAMVMDPATGAVLAAASSNRNAPDFRPRFASFAFEPGGVMAPFVIATALEHNDTTQINASSTIDTDDELYRIDGSYIIRDTKKYASQTITDVLVHASNVGLAKIAVQIDPKLMHDALVSFGFGSKSGIDILQDLPGKLKSEKMLERDLHRVTTAMGYGMLVTPMQLLRAYGVFVNGGKLVTPHIANEQSVSGSQVLSPEAAATMKKMLRENVKRGTGRLAHVAGVKVGGKTGTAHRVEHGKYVNRYNAAFYGYAQDNNRTYVVGVVVIDPKESWRHEASLAAAPVFGEVVSVMYDHGLFETQSDGDKVGKYKGERTISPLEGAVVVRPFGIYNDPEYNIAVFNESVTLKPSQSKAVQAVFDGKVSFAGKSRGLDKVVVLAHKNGLHTVYAGLDTISPSVHTGVSFGKGDTLGMAKKQLLFQVTQNGKVVNPLDVIMIDGAYDKLLPQ